MKDNFQNELLESIMDDNNKKDENFEKIMLLTTEILGNVK